MKQLSLDSDTPYFSRELSWLSFNERVLDEAANPENPLLERFRFLIIVSTNLEEFFRIRISALHRKGADKSRIELMKRIRRWVYDQKNRQTEIFEEVTAGLRTQGFSIEPLGPSPRAEEIFTSKILSEIAPFRIEADKALPHLKGGQLLLLASLSKSFALIQIPPQLPRLWIDKNRRAFLLDRLIASYKHLIFKNTEVFDVMSFKISRDAEIEIDEDADDPLLDMEEGLRDRDAGPIVRLEINALAKTETEDWLKKQLNVSADKIYRFSLPLDLKALMPIYKIKSFKKLKHSYALPQRPMSLKTPLKAQQFFSLLDKEDILLHHPYSSFDPVIELVQNAAQDPKVKRICLMLYRTSGQSPMLDALIQAAKAKKDVLVIVEIKARFDEANNIRMARALERAGARVIYGTAELKIHGKLVYVERLSGKTKKGYVHLGSGNYHPTTARFYTDIGFLTSQPAHCLDAKMLFDMLEKMESQDDFSLMQEPATFSTLFKTWKVSPGGMHEHILQLILQAQSDALEGKATRIRAKMNGLVERSIIDALYKASQAGVNIDLFVRGICCLRPGVKGLSENIRVRSIVDKYLEHSRFSIFECNGQQRVFLSSADWMPRNFFRRVELFVPILNPAMSRYIGEAVWNTYDRDNVRSRICDSEGIYKKYSDADLKVPLRAQEEFEKLIPPSFPRSPEPVVAAIPSPAIPISLQPESKASAEL